MSSTSLNHTSFQISDNVHPDKVFLVNLSEIEGRIDPQYYFAKNKLEIVKNTVYPVEKISNVLDMQRGRFGHRPRNDPKFYDGVYPFIQTGDVVKAHLNKSKIEFSQTLNEKGLKTSRLFNEQVVVFTIAANIGYTAILDYPACFPDSLIAIKPKDDKLLLKYVEIYLSLVREYIESLAPQAAQKNINYQQLSLIPFVVPPVEIQRKIIEENKHCVSIYKEKKIEASRLLASINDYLLTELGITLPEIDNSLSSRIFTIQASQLSDNYDPSIFFNRQYQAEGKKFSNAPLDKAVNFSKGTSISSSRVVKGDYPVVAGGKTSPYSHNTYNFTDETITISASGAYSGYVRYHDYPIFASDCIVLTVQDKDIYLARFVYEILSFKQAEIYRLQKGAGQPHVYIRDLKKILIPHPPINKQQEVVQHIDQIRTTAAQLQQQADEILKTAQQRIEDLILGNIE
ncbi:restriction endonuclease subunit S [Psychrobacter pygoscelis]|uniref:restriction endonuclease subunit S n=1 Tax=Psychrobacter pygoscelis TaxID=2488563 RepID=UPI001038E747|nr:restriction endonuclease subunit S [Psychrobacter pygoscelis]